MPEKRPQRELVGSLLKGLDVLEVLAAHPGGMTLTDMAEKSGMDRAGARRFLLTLVEADYAVRNGRRFSLSPRLLSVARSWLQNSSPWSYAEPRMREVAATLGESCSAAVLSGEDVVYVARVPGARIVSIALHVGTRLPAWCTAMGRVLLADLPEPQLQAFLDGTRIEAKTPRTMTDRGQLIREIARVGAAGFALVDEELEAGLRSIAVPIRDRRGRVVAALNASTHASRTSCDAMRDRFLPLLQRTAASVEDYFALN